MFPNYQAYSSETEAHELKQAERAVRLAVAGGAAEDFAIDLIDRGEIDFHLATPGQGAKVIMEAYSETYSKTMRWGVLDGSLDVR